MNIDFSTNDQVTALSYLKRVYKKEVTEDSSKDILSLVTDGLIRIQDPIMYGNKIRVVPAKEVTKEQREKISSICIKFHNEHKEK